MSSVPGADHPAEHTEVDVRLVSAGVSVPAVVETVHEGVVSVRPSAGEPVGQVLVQPADAVDVYWRTEDGHRAMPAEVTDVQHGAVARWELTATGPVEHDQRRMAVRGRIRVPVQLEAGGTRLTGEALDLSEGGARDRFDGSGPPPQTGTAVSLVLDLEDGPVRVGAEVTRLQTRGTRWTVSMTFASIQERDQDRIRRRVFRALREDRARLAD